MNAPRIQRGPPRRAERQRQTNPAHEALRNPGLQEPQEPLFRDWPLPGRRAHPVLRVGGLGQDPRGALRGSGLVRVALCSRHPLPSPRAPCWPPKRSSAWAPPPCSPWRTAWAAAGLGPRPPVRRCLGRTASDSCSGLPAAHGAEPPSQDPSGPQRGLKPTASHLGPCSQGYLCSPGKGLGVYVFTVPHELCAQSGLRSVC